MTRTDDADFVPEGRETNVSWRQFPKCLGEVENISGKLLSYWRANEQ